VPMPSRLRAKDIWPFFKFYVELFWKAFKIGKATYGFVLIFFPICALIVLRLQAADINPYKEGIAIAIAAGAAIGGMMIVNFLEYLSLKGEVTVIDRCNDLAALLQEGHGIFGQKFSPNQSAEVAQWQAQKVFWVEKVQKALSEKMSQADLSRFNALRNLGDPQRFYSHTHNTWAHNDYAELEKYLENLQEIMDKHEDELRAK